LPADIGGLLDLLDAVGCRRVWEDTLGDFRRYESTEGVEPCC
jgi:hypothetical protein